MANLPPLKQADTLVFSDDKKCAVIIDVGDGRENPTVTDAGLYENINGMPDTSQNVKWDVVGNPRQVGNLLTVVLHAHHHGPHKSDPASHSKGRHHRQGQAISSDFLQITVSSTVGGDPVTNMIPIPLVEATNPPVDPCAP